MKVKRCPIGLRRQGVRRRGSHWPHLQPRVVPPGGHPQQYHCMYIQRRRDATIVMGCWWGGEVGGTISARAGRRWGGIQQRPRLVAHVGACTPPPLPRPPIPRLSGHVPECPVGAPASGVCRGASRPSPHPPAGRGGGGGGASRARVSRGKRWQRRQRRWHRRRQPVASHGSGGWPLPASRWPLPASRCGGGRAAECCRCGVGPANQPSVRWGRLTGGAVGAPSHSDRLLPPTRRARRVPALSLAPSSAALFGPRRAPLPQ